MSESHPWLSSFVPRRGLRRGHLQTIVGNYLRRTYVLPPVENLLVEVEPALPGVGAEYGPTRVLCHCHMQSAEVRRDRLTVLLVHGLEGSSSSRYILSNTARAWAAGFNVVRMNMRSCGGTDALAPTIYHSGRSGDVRAVVEALRSKGLERLAVIGYSMGGNLVLKFAGEQALAARELQPLAVVGISPLMDLAVSSAALHEPANRLYEWKFLRAMLGRIRRKALLFPKLYSVLEREGVPGRIHSLRDFDHQIVARFGGFRDADDYYQTVRSSHFASAFRTPTLILHSLDDPFIRMLPSTREALSGNANVTFIETMHGGHCAFLAEPTASRDTFWAEHTLLGFLLAVDRGER